MRWRQKDPLRWRRRFALLPRRIGKQWIWLERYSWRPVPSGEAAKLYPLPNFHRPCWLEEFRCGDITGWRLSILPLTVTSPIARMWVDVQPQLRVVA